MRGIKEKVRKPERNRSWHTKQHNIQDSTGNVPEHCHTVSCSNREHCHTGSDTDQLTVVQSQRNNYLFKIQSEPRKVEVEVVVKYTKALKNNITLVTRELRNYRNM